MNDSFALTPPLRVGAPPTLEARAMFRVKAAFMQGPPAPSNDDPEIVLMHGSDGGVVVYPPSEKLVILAAARARLRPTRAVFGF